MCSAYKIRVGDRFSSFSELEAAIRLLEEAQGITFWKRDSRTIKGASKRLKYADKKIKPALKYQQVVFACMKGGRKYVSRGNKTLHGRRTFKENCLACIKVSASKDGQNLVVVRANLVHNHITPQVRQKSDKDLNRSEDKRLNRILAKLKQNKDCILEVLQNEEHVLKGVYYQGKKMQNHFALFPEVLLVDATCRLKDLLVYIHLAADGNAECELVSLFVVSDDSEMVSAMVDIFKFHNSAWGRTQLLVTDETSVEREVYARHFPKAQQLLSPFHVFQKVTRDINRMDNVTPRQKQQSLELFEQIAQSGNETNYQKNVELLYKRRVQPIIDYYNQTWHPISEQWVVALKECYLYGQNTTNQFAHFHCVLNHSVLMLKDLRGFMHALKLVVKNLQRALSEAVLEQLHVRAKPNSPESRYEEVLTPYAAQLASIQLELSKGLHIPYPVVAGDTVHLLSSLGPVNITSTTCTCQFAIANKLPCHHIFAFRAKCGLDMFFEEGIAPRWCLKYYSRKGMLGDWLSEGEEPSDSPLTAAEKYRHAASVTRRLTMLTSAASEVQQKERLAVLQQLLHFWEENKHATVVELPKVF